MDNSINLADKQIGSTGVHKCHSLKAFSLICKFQRSYSYKVSYSFVTAGF